MKNVRFGVKAISTDIVVRDEAFVAFFFQLK